MKEETRKLLVISALGKDRPGIVDEFSEFVLEHGCNIEDSRMAVLGGEFAFIVLVSGSAKDVQRVRHDIDVLAGKSGLIVTEKPTTTAHLKDAARVPYRLSGTGMDHPGVVHRFSHLLHGRSVNIASMDTHSYNAPISGTPLFHFDMVIEVPSSVPLSELRTDLTRLADEENVDVQLSPVS